MVRSPASRFTLIHGQIGIGISLFTLSASRFTLIHLPNALDFLQFQVLQQQQWYEKEADHSRNKNENSPPINKRHLLQLRLQLLVIFALIPLASHRYLGFLLLTGT